MSDSGAARPNVSGPDGWLAVELRSQPDAVRRVEARAEELVAAVRAAVAGADPRALLVAGRGTSDNAARSLQYLAGIRLGLPVALAAPSITSIHGAELRLRDIVVIAVSQSGASPDVVSVVVNAVAQGAPTLAVTNDPTSPLARAATTVLDLGAGPERAVAATRTYTASLAMLLLVAAGLGDSDFEAEMVGGLATVPDLMERTLIDAADPVERLIADGTPQHLVVVGRGYDYATASETALKVRELSRTVAESFSPPDLLHGPIAAVGPDTTVLLVATDAATIVDHRELVRVVAAQGARTVAITTDADLAAVCDRVVLLQPLPGWLTPFTAILPGQLLAAGLARAAGLDPDNPDGLTKVTRTR
ncbi:MAG: SIS domain-containing protein [Actinomycetota bacterium]|nr:SIS domain-containing protein [Actinomycetota bacterium]